MKLAIVGAGVAGLAAIQKALQFKVECVAYEKTENIGGTWVYYEEIPEEYQDEMPSCMYPSLRTNLPTCLMEFRDYKFEPESGRCFPGRSEVLKYIENYVREFKLQPHIKFFHKVLNISRNTGKWVIKVKNLKTGLCSEEKFDGVMICSGHFSVPNYPVIRGMDTFPGHQMHSCYYRTNNFFKEKTVLIIGRGASALDLCREVALVADKVFLSHEGKPLIIRPKNIIQKPKLKEINFDTIVFVDDTSELVDSIIYCTGFKYDYPFLDASCEINNSGEVIYPLYKNFINAKHPTMCITGLMQKTIIFQLVDLQAEVFIKSLCGIIDLPSTEEMLFEVERERQEKIISNTPDSHYYYLGSKMMKQYFNELINLGKCKPYPLVIFDIYEKNSEYFAKDYDNLRKYVYTITNECTFSVRLDKNEIFDKEEAE